MKKNLSKIFGVLIAVLSLSGLAACLVHFNKTENVSSPSSSNNTASTEEENPPIPFVEKDTAYKFEDGHSYIIPLNKLQDFYEVLWWKTFSDSNENVFYETYLDLDFSLMNINLDGSKEGSNPSTLGFPVYLFNGTLLPNGDRFTSKLENFVYLISKVNFIYISGVRRVPHLIPLYNECHLSLYDYFSFNEGESSYGMKMQFNFVIRAEDVTYFVENNLEDLYDFGETYGSFVWPEDLNQDGSASCTFVMDIFEINNWSEFSLTGSLEGFVFNKAAQVSINERWSDDVFNAWMYANLYAEEMSV